MNRDSSNDGAGSGGKYAGLTNAYSDTESGNENLPRDTETKKAIKALRKMKARGLITEAEYAARIQELES